MHIRNQSNEADVNSLTETSVTIHTDASSNKAQLRTQFRSLRQNFKKNNPEASSRVAQKIGKFIYKNPGVWGLYLTCGSELCLDSLLKFNFPGIRLCVPKVQVDEMHFYAISPETSWETGAFGIREPRLDFVTVGQATATNPEQIAPEQLTGLVVPGLAFDRWGGRLGQGRSFYDRYLQNSSAIKVAAAFSCQIYEQRIPLESHDVLMDWIFTENQIIDCRMNRKDSAL